MNLKKIGKVFTSNSVGTGPSSHEKCIYRAAVSQRLRNTGLDGKFQGLMTVFTSPRYCVGHTKITFWSNVLAYAVLATVVK